MNSSPRGSSAGPALVAPRLFSGVLSLLVMAMGWLLAGSLVRADLVTNANNGFARGLSVSFNHVTPAWGATGPVEIGTGLGESVLWRASPVGYLGVDNSAFGSNYWWDFDRGLMAASAINPDGTVTMSFTFATAPVTAAGAFLNYSTGPYTGNYNSTVVAIEALDAQGNILERYNILTDAPIQATAVNDGGFRGIVRAKADIATIRFVSDGRFFAIDDLAFARFGGPTSARPVNIATRAYCGAGNQVTIGGFVIAGSASKRVLIRAVGPSLTGQGLSAASVLADPAIEVRDALHGNAFVARNNDWTENTNAAEITAVARQVGATSLATNDVKSSALVLTLAPGVYTFVASANEGAAGIVLIEVYDADGATASTFSNIATRAYATTGDGVAIGGFVVSGAGPKRVLLRAVGPTLKTQGLGEAEVLADPQIELHDALNGNATIATNDDWSTNSNAGAITMIGARIGATPLDASDTKSAALLLTLQAGVYSFIASGKAAAPSGIVLVEVYDAD